MNYLAHVVLGEPTGEGALGSLMGDFVKGAIDPSLPEAIRHGIECHRRIDAFTDAHPAHRRARGRFVAPRRRFGGVIVDVAFDHFLIRHWERFVDEPLETVCDRAYRALAAPPCPLPGRLAEIAPRMGPERWLESYQDLRAVGRALDGIARRRERARPLRGALAEVRANYEPLDADFLTLFPDLQAYAHHL